MPPKKQPEPKLEYFEALRIEKISSINKKELTEVIKAAADWAAIVANERIEVTFLLKFSRPKEPAQDVP